MQDKNKERIKWILIGSLIGTAVGTFIAPLIRPLAQKLYQEVGILSGPEKKKRMAGEK